MNGEPITEKLERMDAVKHDLLMSMTTNDLEPDEALSLLASMLVQIYGGFVVDASKEKFVVVLGKSYDLYTLLKSEAQGGVQ